MKTLYVNRKIVNGPWGGGNNFRIMLESLAGQNSWKVTDDSALPCDAILALGLGSENGTLSFEACQELAYERKIPIFIRCNDNDARKRTFGVDRIWADAMDRAFGVIFVSNWLMQNMSESVGLTRLIRARSTVIKNGVDTAIFKPSSKLDNGKINLVMAHWSDNPMKGQECAEWLDKFVGQRSQEFTFTYIGRTRASFSHSTHIGPLFGAMLGTELGRYDVCINASQFDPGPNSVLEPIACGLPTYVHINGGGGVEFAGRDHAFSSFEELRNLLNAKQFSQNKLPIHSWDACVKSCFDFIDQRMTEFNV